ncbi:TPA: acyltransferase, partial [Raoultella ornithinolytica]|nr:acyltransferase [Raoultella ornithinolytica]
MLSDKVVVRGKLDWIEYLRGVACLAVILQHYAAVSSDYFNLGNFGVVLFFFISGFIVTLVTVRKENESAFSFLCLRIGRLYPAYIFSVLVAIAISSVTHFSDILKNITMLPLFLGGKPLLGVYWTLHVEWVFYFLLALFLFVPGGITIKRLKFSFVLFCVITILLGCVRYFLNIKSPVALTIGMSTILISAILSIDETKKGRVIYSSLYFILIILLSSFLSFSKDWGHGEQPLGFVLSSVAAIVVFFSFKKNKVVFGGGLLFF